MFWMAPHRNQPKDKISNDQTRPNIHCDCNKNGWFRVRQVESTTGRPSFVIELVECIENFDQDQSNWVLDVVQGTRNAQNMAELQRTSAVARSDTSLFV